MASPSGEGSAVGLDLRPFAMQGGPPIPWFLAEIIHRHLYRFSQPLEVVHQRGGFGWAEVQHLARENSKADQRKAAYSEARDAMKRASHDE